jgi:hypothetical protein
MAKKATGRAGYLVSGLGFGVAAGVVLGVIALGPNMPGNQNSQDETAVAEPAAESAETSAERERNERRIAASDEALAQLIPGLVDDTLSGNPVLVMATADADRSDVDAVTWLLDAAGARGAGTLTLTEQFFAQDSAEELTGIVADVFPDQESEQSTEDAPDPGSPTGEAFGRALMLAPETGEQQSSVEERAQLLQSLREAGFIDYEDGTILPAQVIMVITGDDDGSTDGAFAARTLASFTAALDDRGAGTVLAGQLAAAGEQGPIGVVRAQDAYADNITTVDSVDLEVGRGATVLGVAEQLAGEAGAYGAAEDAQAPLPEPPA